MSVRRNDLLAVALYGLGITAFGITLLVQRFVAADGGSPIQLRDLPRLLPGLLPLVPVALLAVSLLTVDSRGLEYLSLGAWLLSMPLALVAAWPLSGWPAVRLSLWLRKSAALLVTWQGLAVVSLLAVGAILRLYDMEGIPSGVHGDETGFGLIAGEVLSGKGPNPFGTAFLGDRALYVYLQAPFLALLGHQVAALRLSSVLGGVLTLAVFYVLMRRFFGVRPALFALALLAGSALHINYSRLGLNLIQVPLITCVALYALWRGQETRQRFWWLATGISSGLVVYFHFSGLLAIATVALYFLYLFATRPRAWLRWAHGAVWCIVGGVIALAPVILYQMGRTDHFQEHVGGRLIFNNWNHVTSVYHTGSVLAILWEQIKTNLLVFFAVVDGGTFYAFAGSPLLPRMLGSLFALGLILTLWRARDGRHAILILWFWIVVIVGGALTIDSPQSHRLLPALLPALAAIALFLDWLVGIAPRLGGISAAAAAWGLAVLLPLAAVSLDDANYFGRAVQARPWEPSTAQARYVSSLGQEYRAFGLSAPHLYFDHSTTRFLAPDVEGKTLQNPAESLPVAVSDDRDVAFLVYPHMSDYLPLLKSYYANWQAEVIVGRSDRPVFTALRVPRTDIQQYRGLTASYGALSRMESDTAALGGASASYPVPVIWSGSLYVEQNGRYAFRIEGVSAQLFIDDTALDSNVERELSIGWHTIRITGQLAGPENRPKLEWRPPRGQFTLIPPSHLDSRALGGNLRSRITNEGGSTIERLDRAIGFRNAAMVWGRRQPATVVWEGMLQAPRPGRYSISVTSAGDAEVIIGGQTVAANREGRNELRTASGDITLSVSPEPITVRYVWRQGDGAIDLLWTPPDGERTIIPAEAFAPPLP